MPEESPSARHRQEKLSKTPRSFNGLSDGPRILTKVESTASSQSDATPKAAFDPGVGASWQQAGQPEGQNGTAEHLIDLAKFSSPALEELLTKTHNIYAEVWRAAESLITDLHLKLRQECENRITEFEREIRERAHYQTVALLEQIDLEAESRLNARFDAALDKARQVEKRSLQQLNEGADANRTALAELANTTIRELQALKNACREELQLCADNSLANLRKKIEVDFKEAIQKSKASINEIVIKQETEKALAFQKRLELMADEVVGRAGNKLNSMAEGALTRVTNDAQAVVAREASTYLVEVLRKRLDQIAGTLKG
jgi:hypothetical protein